jgi:hypothetical protein
LKPPRQTRPGGIREDIVRNGRNLPSQRVGNSAIGEEELHAVIELIVQRHLGDRDLDRDLQFRSVELIQCPLDDAVVFRIGVDNDTVVRDVGGDPDARQDRALSTGCRCVGIS